jgi:hypothetical protein
VGDTIDLDNGTFFQFAGFWRVEFLIALLHSLEVLSISVDAGEENSESPMPGAILQ